MNAHSAELVRYAINGLIATAAHYASLRFNIEILNFPSAAAANMAAAVIGITVSFLGSRYFVFRKTLSPIIEQAFKFASLYALIAVFHGLALLIWTDWLKYDYRIGFAIATVVQVSMSYLGNKLLVFKA